ncbi:MAG: Tripartite-type tricarboxylate transporter, receptor component TctC [Rubritepida sp.]|nr:Tripartite-type tricarboxylate transporter, receptor component TctC [Rubritepida sp.]
MTISRRILTAGAALLPLTTQAQTSGQTGAPAPIDTAIRSSLNELKPRGFPREPVEMTVVYPAGGGMDITGRLLQRLFERATGDHATVNNRTGGAGLVGHTWIATQAPGDGHAVGLVSNLIFSDAARSGGRWSWTDIDHIAHVNAEPLNLVVNAEGPFKSASLRDVLDAVKARPGTIRVANLPGGYYEYLIEQLEAASGARFLRVPFQGGAPGITALLGNNVDLAFGFFAEVRSHLAADRLKAIAVTGRQRTLFLPDAPTVNSVVGREDVNWGVSRWVALPKAVPADRKAWLAAAYRAAVALPEADQEFRSLGAMPDPALDTPEKLRAAVERMAQEERNFLATRAPR